MVIEADKLCLGYGGKPVVKDLSLSVPAGSWASIIGPNGCGKSTLLKALSRNLKPVSGSVRVMDRPLENYGGRSLARTMAFLAQTPQIPDYFSVKELVGYGRYPHTGWFGSLRPRDREAVEQALEATDMLDFSEREVASLSGGERQRAWIAMALAQEAELLLFDEPTTHFDIAYQFQILELIDRLRKEMGRTVVTVLHDLNQAARYSDQLFVMKNGCIFATGEPSVVLTPQLLGDVFSIDVRLLQDEELDCPFVVPLGGKQQ
ncbi:ABC transporter ATP-binding protein [Sediminispirochaeta bajacaliforniensis]|uniref:ABC transporter ATP-binding protein n=1 Tax=Sediminispirochaeta bajacaliforniensis TaxID=148 RepID=UPI00037CC7E0|nr:ABC transporter ATP-binding protein [Sediminispirochaeta bajacaliforniensis]